MCTVAEHVVYAGLGGFVLATGILAWLTGGYALYTIMAPTDGGASLGAALSATVFGAFWGAMIFNLDRYIVASSSKGDGKESISFTELKNAAPRMVLALVIGLVMSTPLELRIFQREIEVELAKRRKDRAAEIVRVDSVRAATERRSADSALTKINMELDSLQSIATRLEQDYANEATGAAGTGKAGMGPIAAMKQKQASDARARFDETLKRKDPERIELSAKQRALDADLRRSSASADSVSRQLGGLIDRIEIAHDKGGAITWIVRLLIILLEIIPVLSKLMYRTGPYDVLLEHVRAIIPARLGAGRETFDIVSDGRLVTRSVDSFPLARIVYDRATAALSSLRTDVSSPAPSSPPDGTEDVDRA